MRLLGGSMPLVKMLLAGLLYLGSGLGLAAIRLLRDRGWRARELINRFFGGAFPTRVVMECNYITRFASRSEADARREGFKCRFLAGFRPFLPL